MVRKLPNHLNLNRYIKLNLLDENINFEVNGNKICFFSIDYNLYCYNYEDSYNYPLPPLITQYPNNKVIGGYDFVNDNNNPMDENGHGTHVAGIAAGSGFGGLKGVAPDALLYSYKVLNKNGAGYTSDVIAAIEQAVIDRVDIISLSLGVDCKKYYNGYNKNCGPEDSKSIALNNAVNSGIIAVVSAGNTGPDFETIESPGTSEKSITVGAVDKKDKIAQFSSRGPVLGLIKPDIVAPGVNICSAEYDFSWSDRRCFDNKHIGLSGTSMATPHVAGAAAILKQKNPGYSPENIKVILKSKAIDLGFDSNTEGSGRIDVLKLLESCMTDSDCGINKNLEEIHCYKDELYYNYANYKCLNSGTISAKCNEILTKQLVLSCFNGCYNNYCLDKPETKISNYGNNIVKGNLAVGIQFQNKKGKWVNYKTIINKQVSVPINSLYRYESDFNNKNIKIKDKGNYRLISTFTVNKKTKSFFWEFKVL